MAVEARHLGFFPSSHHLVNREMIGVNEGNPTGVFHNGSIGYVAQPLSGTTTETLYPMYSSFVADSLPANAAVTSRKRSRDSVNPLSSFPMGCQFMDGNNSGSGCFGFLGEDMSLRFQHEQLEIERFISQHTERVKMEIEGRRKRQARRILAAVEQCVMKKIRDRDEEIENIGKLNWALEEKVKSLYMENQIWRDLAQSNEATVNTLRGNLEQVLSAVRNEGGGRGENRNHNRWAVVVDGGEIEAAAALVDHEESCCGSNDIGGGEEEEEEEVEVEGGRRRVAKGGKSMERMCRNCCTEEASVLLLPCRHLCLCSVCGSCVHVCPICKASKNASVNINLSP